jgi:indoleamine 2,3-dioxygenase
MVSQVPEFHVLDDPKPDDVTLPAFMVSKTRGFLPRQVPSPSKKKILKKY